MTLLRAAQAMEIAANEGVLFDAEQCAVLELDTPALDAWRWLSERGPADQAEIEQHVGLEVARELFLAGLVRPDDVFMPRLKEPEKVPVRSLVLNVSQSCNLACGYCYADVKIDKRAMSEETGRQSIDFLLRESGDTPVVKLSFFGGEPLLNFALVEKLVAYARQRGEEQGKRFHFALTTNGTLLREEIVDFLLRERISVTVSMDGSQEAHDRNRPMKGGRGSYERILPGLKRLLAGDTRRPIGARVTLTRGSGSILPIYNELRALGFHEVGFSPVTDRRADFYLESQEMDRLIDDFEQLSLVFLDELKAGRHPGFSNLSNLLAELHRGEMRSHACGAGLGLVGTDWQGGLYLCHRFSGDQEFRLGDVRQGLNTSVRKKLLHEISLEARSDCHTCWARSLCAGGCHHEARERTGDVGSANLHSCDWIRRWISHGLQLYVDLHRQVPGILDRLAGSRRGEGDSKGDFH